MSALHAGAQPPLGHDSQQPSLWGTALGHFSSNYTFYFMLNWLPMYLVSARGFSVGAMATLVSQAYLVNALSALLAGWLIDRLIIRTARTTLAYKSSMLAGHIGSMACMLCIALAPPAWSLGAIFVYQVLLGISSPGTFAISQILAGPNAAARWVGIQNALANVAGMVAPLLTGELVQRTHHYTSAFVVAALINVLGVFAWVRIVGPVTPVRWASSPQPAPHSAPLLENSAP